MPGKTRVCYKCKMISPVEEMTKKNERWLCQSCLKESSDYESFSKEICEIFHIKSPGPKINTKRAQLKKTYGYTDRTIINTFKYCYEIKGIKNLTQSFGILNPELVEEAKYYMKNKESIENDTLIAVTNVKYNQYFAPHLIDSKDNSAEYDILEHIGDDDF